jgi:micrococcal nuclease
MEPQPLPLRAIVPLLFVIVSACASSPALPSAGGAPIVTDVVDGDTIVVKIDDEEATVRLIGVDTPETVHPDRPVECFGPEATAFTESLVPPGTPVSLERDQEERDAFGRLLLYVRGPDGTFVNEQLVAAGLGKALVIPPNDAYAPLMRAAEGRARAAGAGLWGACEGSAGPAP